MSGFASNTYERNLIVALLIFLVLIPLPLGSSQLWAMAIIAIVIGSIGCAWGLGMWLGKIRPSKALKPSLPLFFILLAAQLWLALQWLFGNSNDPPATALLLVLGVSYSLLFLLVISMFGTRKRLLLLLTTLFISGALQAFYGVFMVLSGMQWDLLGEAVSSISATTGTFTNSYYFTAYIGLTLSCGIGLLMALRSTGKWNLTSTIELVMGPKALLRLALVVSVIALLMTRTSAASLAFFSATLVMGALFIVRNKESGQRNILILLSVILVEILVISQYFGVGSLKDYIAEAQVLEVVEVNPVEGVSLEVLQQSNKFRDQVVIDALPLVMENSSAVQDVGSFADLSPQYANELVQMHFGQAHNDFLQFFVEYGVIGSALLTIFVSWALCYAFAALWQTRSLFANGLGLGISIGIVSLMIHSLGGFSLQAPANTAIFVTLCAIAVLIQNHSRREQRATS